MNLQLADSLDRSQGRWIVHCPASIHGVRGFTIEVTTRNRASREERHHVEEYGCRPKVYGRSAK